MSFDVVEGFLDCLTLRHAKFTAVDELEGVEFGGVPVSRQAVNVALVERDEVFSHDSWLSL